MAIQLRTIDLPIDGGLSQKTEALWLAPGASLTASNLVKLKTGALTKRLGFKTLTTSGTSPAKSDATAGTAVTLTAGKRLSSFRGSLVQVGVDAWTDAMWSYDDRSAEWVMLDRVPELYLRPYEQLAGTDAVVSSVDCALVGGYEVFAWADPSNTVSCPVTFMVRNATTGEVIQPATLLSSSATFVNADQVALTVVGSTVLLTFSTPNADNNIYGAILTPAPGAAWGAITRINTTAGDAISSRQRPIAYGIAPVISDTAHVMLFYQTTIAGASTLRLIKLNYPALTSAAATTTDPVDATWTADYGGVPSHAFLTGIAIRADSANNEIGLAYAWINNGAVVRLSVGQRVYSTLASAANTIEIAGGSALQGAADSPFAVSLERIGVMPALVNAPAYKVRASNGGPTWQNGTVSNIFSVISSWIVVPTTTTVVSERRTYGAILWSKDVLVNGIAYCIGYNPGLTQGTFYVFADDAWSDFTSTTAGPYGNAFFPLRLVGTIAPRLSGNLARVTAPFPAQVGVRNVPLSGSLARVMVTSSSTPSNSVPTLAVFDFASTQSHQPGELGANLLLGSGCPSGFDGTQAFELAFPYYPVLNVTLGAGANLNGTYAYIATYEWTDARGQIHRSGRSVPVSVTTAGAQGATINVGVMGFSAKVKAQDASFASNLLGGGPQGWWGAKRQVMIRVWRTQNGGSLFNLVATVPNVTSAQTVSVTDALTDAQIQGNALLYGDGSNGTDAGSILDNLCPPAFQHLLVHKSRAIGIDGPRVWPSKAYTTGEGSGFNEGFAFSVDDGPGNLTALATLDDKLILFKADRLFYMLGDGPSDNGVVNDFTPPQRIASDAGCVDWRSIASTAEGVYFLSATGRKLLTRDLQVVPVPVVEDIDAANPVQTSGIVHPNEGRILWTQNADDVSVPRVGQHISRNYVLDAWTTGAAGSSSTGMVSAAVANVPISGTNVATYHMLDAGGNVWREKNVAVDSLPYADGSGFVTGTWSSPWLKSDGLQGWSHWALVRLLLQMVDPANLTVSLFYNYSSSPTDVRNYTAAQVAAFTTPFAQFPIQPTNARAESMRIQIADAQGGSPVTGQGFKLFGVRVDYGVEPGGFRAPVAQQG